MLTLIVQAVIVIAAVYTLTAAIKETSR